MKRLVTFSIALLLAAGLVSAEPVRTVLTLDSTLYTIAPSKEFPHLELTKRNGDEKKTLIVPTSDDDALESEASLLYDSCSNSLFVLWHATGEGVDAVRLAVLNGAGEWSAPMELANGAHVRRAGLQMLLTHSHDEESDAKATLIHAAWWSIGGDVMPEYAIIAFEGGEHVSTEIADLRHLAESPTPEDALEPEDTGVADHPPLAMAKQDSEIDVAFGAPDTTAITRVRITPKKVIGNARIWRPIGRYGGRTGPAQLVSHNSNPVQAFISNGRVVLYTPESQFRFIVHEKGQWTPIRMIELDDTITTDGLLRELRRTVEEHSVVETGPIVE
ncbi:MAG: hypothetical protein ACLGH0_09345 [Thermoanaerobaculia bacterium]